MSIPRNILNKKTSFTVLFYKQIRKLITKQLRIQKQSDKNTQTSELALSHKYGYKFEFKSNGLSQQDKLEIAKALEDITPKIDELINNKNQKKCHRQQCFRSI